MKIFEKKSRNGDKLGKDTVDTGSNSISDSPMSKNNSQKITVKSKKRAPLVVVSVCALLIISGGFIFLLIKDDRDSGAPVPSETSEQASEDKEQHKLSPLTPEEEAVQREYDEQNPKSQESDGSATIYSEPPPEAGQEAPKPTVAVPVVQ